MGHRALKKLAFPVFVWVLLELYGSSPARAQATTENMEAEKAVVTHYTLRLDDPLRNLKPLPDKFPVSVIIHFIDGTEKEYLAAKGWDFNADGRIDMIQVKGNDGDDTAYIFDFDGDSKPDFVKLRKAPSQKNGTESWSEHLVSEQERLFAKPEGSQENIRIGADGKVEIVSNDQSEKAKEFERFWGLDLGLDMSSTKFGAKDTRTEAKADFYTKQNGAFSLGLNYFWSHSWTFKAITAARSMSFEKGGQESGFSDDKQHLVILAFFGPEYEISDRLATKILVGADQQLFLNSDDGASVQFKKVLIPKVKWDLAWDFLEAGNFTYGVLLGLDYGFGGKSGAIKAKSDLGYQFSALVQRSFRQSILSAQLDYRHQAQITTSLKQEQTDIGLVLNYSMPLGRSSK